MLYSIPAEEIDKLSLELIIYKMFKDNQEIIDGYNNRLIKRLRDKDTLEYIDNLKKELISINSSMINGELPEDAQNKLISELGRVAQDYDRFLQDTENLKKAESGKKQIEEQEKLFMAKEQEELNNLFASMDNLI